MRTEWMTNGSHKEGSNSFSLLSLYCCLSMMRLTICFGYGQLYFRQHFTGFQPTGYGCMCVAVWFVIFGCLYVWVCGIPVIGNILPQSIPWQNGNHWWAGRIWIPPESIPQHRLVLSRALLVAFILFVFHHLQPLLDGGTCQASSLSCFYVYFVPFHLTFRFGRAFAVRTVLGPRFCQRVSGLYGSFSRYRWKHLDFNDYLYGEHQSEGSRILSWSAVSYQNIRQRSFVGRKNRSVWKCPG